MSNKPKSKKIIGIDIDLRASRFMVDNHGLEDVTLIDVDDGLGIIELETIDTILALDVLEHVDDLEGILGTFKKLLCPTGQIIVCGPSETFFYRLGRKLAGFEDHSHLRNILDIEKDLRSFFDVQLIARLYPPITLFRITTARLK